MSNTLVIVPCGQGKVWDDDPQRGPTPACKAYQGVPGTPYAILGARGDLNRGDRKLDRLGGVPPFRRRRPGPVSGLGTSGPGIPVVQNPQARRDGLQGLPMMACIGPCRSGCWLDGCFTVFLPRTTRASRDRDIVVVDVDITTPTLPMLALAMESRCADTAVIRNLTLNPSFNPLLVYQFRILSTNPSLSIATLNRYLIAT